MHKAAFGGHLEVIKFLSTKFGARVYDKDINGYTMLHWAAEKGHCEVARYLIEELKMDPQDKDKVCGVAGEKVCMSKAEGLCTVIVAVCDTLNSVTV